jgi:hypothetical protein
MHFPLRVRQSVMGAGIGRMIGAHDDAIRDPINDTDQYGNALLGESVQSTWF